MPVSGWKATRLLIFQVLGMARPGIEPRPPDCETDTLIPLGHHDQLVSQSLNAHQLRLREQNVS